MEVMMLIINLTNILALNWKSKLSGFKETRSMSLQKEVITE